MAGEVLTQKRVQTLLKAGKPGLYNDGEVRGLYLKIGRTGAASWVLRYTWQGKLREMGLGGLADVPLPLARAKAQEARGLLAAGVDPLASRRAAEAAIATTPAPVTFRAVAEAYIARHEHGWRNPVHRRQWRQTLTDYVFPIIGDRPVAEITLDDVRHVLDQPVGERSLWLAHPESASRIRGRIEAILEAAAAQGLRDPNTANPAAWRRLKHFYPAKTKIQPVQHHAALAYAELPALWQKLTATPGVAARCLRFLILTAARSSEARGATWDEIDLDRATWTIPAARMKAGRPHEVPLSSPALTILEEVPPAQRGGLLFPGKGRLGRPVSDTMLAKLLPPGATVHGMRSAFRSWAADHGVARELAEAALAHVIGSAVERAYQRSNLLERRRDLMHQWSGFVTKLVPLPNDYDTIISMD